MAPGNASIERMCKVFWDDIGRFWIVCTQVEVELKRYEIATSEVEVRRLLLYKFCAMKETHFCVFIR